MRAEDELLEKMPKPFKILRVAYLAYLKAEKRGDADPVDVAVAETLKEFKEEKLEDEGASKKLHSEQS